MGVTMKTKVRVLAADDSAVMREVLRMVFAMHGAGSPVDGVPAMELVGVVCDGIEALEAVRTMQPDVLLLDLEMPRLHGLGVLEKLRVTAPALPVIMCSAHTERGARATLDALAAGAKDYVMKPAQSRDFASALDALMKQMLPKIAALVKPCASGNGGRRMDGPVLVGKPAEMVVIGVSTGGPAALEAMLPALSKELPVPVMIVQHMPKLFTSALAERLDRLCDVPVMQATNGMTVRRGTVLLAPGDAHMELARGAGETLAVRLHQGPSRNSCKPSVDYLFESAAKVLGGGTLAVVLTGMGQDGLDGAIAVKRAGGTVLAQDEETSAVWGMPGKVVKEGVAACALPLGEMAQAILRRLARETRREMAYGVL